MVQLPKREKHLSKNANLKREKRTYYFLRKNLYYLLILQIKITSLPVVALPLPLTQA